MPKRLPHKFPDIAQWGEDVYFNTDPGKVARGFSLREANHPYPLYTKNSQNTFIDVYQHRTGTLIAVGHTETWSGLRSVLDVFVVEECMKPSYRGL